MNKSYSSDIEENKGTQDLHQSRPRHIKRQESSKYNISKQSKDFECSFGVNNLLSQKFSSHYQTFDNTKKNTGGKLTQMLLNCAQHSEQESNVSSSLTPVEEKDTPVPLKIPKPEKSYQSFKNLKKSRGSKYDRIQYKNEWSSYGSSFSEFPSHLFKSPERNKDEIT